MARFDVYLNPDKREQALIPFFLDLQSDHIKGLQTRIVVPLWRLNDLTNGIEQLNPEFEVAGQRVVMDTPSLGAVPSSALTKKVDSLASAKMQIQNALDAVFGCY